MYFELLLWTAPAVLLGLWAQMRVRSTYAEASRQMAPLSGAAAARHLLDGAGLNGIDIEQIPGQLSDHYDPRAKVLRLSPDVYQGRTLAAVGIAAHETGHAIQDARNYAPLMIRNAAVPTANFGSQIGMVLLMVGLVFSMQPLLLLGILLFSCVVFFQIVNLPVEFDASARAKALLVQRGIVSEQQMPYVRRVLSAAAWTYVAATLQVILTLLFYVMQFAGGNRD